MHLPSNTKCTITISHRIARIARILVWTHVSVYYRRCPNITLMSLTTTVYVYNGEPVRSSGHSPLIWHWHWQSGARVDLSDTDAILDAVLMVRCQNKPLLSQTYQTLDVWTGVECMASKHETLIQWWVDVGPSARHWPNINPALVQSLVFVVHFIATYKNCKKSHLKISKTRSEAYTNA